MMKRMLAVLLCLLCLALPALAETADISVVEGRVVPREDGSVLLHLLLHKSGPAVQVETVGGVFLDAEGNTVTMDSVRLYAAPMLTLPDGEVDFPVILEGIPAAGAAEVAGFRVEHVATASPQGAMPRLLDDAPGYFLMKTPQGDEMTVYTFAADGSDPADYVGYAFVYDPQGAYLGNVILPRGGAAFVPGDKMLSTLAPAIHWTEEELLTAGFPTALPDCILYGGVSMDDLPRDVAPGDASIRVWLLPAEEMKTLEVVGFNMVIEGTQFINYAVLRNVSAGFVHLEAVPGAVFYDADNQVCDEVTLAAPFRVLAPGETLPIILTGTLPEGYKPVACGFPTHAASAAEADHGQITQDWTPEDGDASGVIAVLVCEDGEGNLLQVGWTSPGEATVADGRIILDESALLEATPDGARVWIAWYRVDVEAAAK